jgi:hypothetical protein
MEACYLRWKRRIPRADFLIANKQLPVASPGGALRVDGTTLPVFGNAAPVIGASQLVEESATPISGAPALAIGLALLLRVTVDSTSLDIVRRIVNAVKSDPQEGEDGELYAAMGFVRRSDRSSGLLETEGGIH